MAIIYPPFIGETIPGFAGDSTNGYTIKIPFTMNPVVSETEVAGFALLIKDYITFDVVATLYAAADWTLTGWYDINTKSGKITFSTSDTEFTPDSLLYYKFLLGYLSEYDDNEDPPSNEKIYYSTASIGRCIGTVPTVSINGLNDDTVNTEKGIYTGNVTGNEEKIYSYQFKLFEGDNILEDSGEILNVDDTYKYKLKYNLEDNTKSILFFIKTINGYEGESSKYTLQPMSTSLDNYSIIATSSSPEEGYIQLTFLGTNNSSSNTTEYYLLERTTDFQYFDKLITFKVNQDQIPTQKDYSVEQGTKYYYSIRQVDENGIYLSARKYYQTDDENPMPIPVSVDYEDIILAGLDGKILKIKFDPKVSSFKNTILESKTDTIGSKYPFFFRNGDINYKEIPLSGLISYHMDSYNNDTILKFMTNAELGFPYTVASAAAGSYNSETHSMPGTQVTETVERGVSLSGPNIAAERKFRLAVLDWLSNGEPKLFRSPTEGVYVIRLMNVSLSPNDTLGRMLYSFSATGYEVSDHDIETLVNKKYISFIEDFIQASSKLGYFILGISRLGGTF